MADPSDVIVIGGGQAGLAVSHELERRSVDHVILEGAGVASSWAGLWEGFRLNTPSWTIDLPGMPYDGRDPDGFMPRDGIVEHLRRYAATLSAPMLEGVAVSRLTADDDGITLATSRGPMTSRSVVVCTGTYRRPHEPAWVAALPPDLAILDTRSYREPAALPAGGVLVVGSGQSGLQIAEELLDAGREVALACGKAPWAPRRTAGHDLVWWALETGFLDGTIDDLPSPRARFTANVTASGVDGGHDLHPRTLRAKGATLAGHVAGAEPGRIEFHDDLAESVAWGDARYAEFRHDVEALSAERGLEEPGMLDPEPFDPSAPASIDSRGLGAVILSSGFRPDYSWIEVPGAFDEMGFPIQVDGTSTVEPRLSFAGVHLMRKRRSSLLCGVGEDAAVVADGIVRRLG